MKINPTNIRKQLNEEKIRLQSDELKGSQTEKNLQEAFSGESKAYSKYLFFASKARKDGYEQIADIFEETAANEKEHAKIWFKILNGIFSTEENLEDSIYGELDEHTRMYPEFAKVAREEGFSDIADLFEGVAAIEKAHEDRFKTLLSNIDKGIVFSRDNDTIWKCRNCGNLIVAKEAPEICPVCEHEQSYFEINSNNF